MGIHQDYIHYFAGKMCSACASYDKRKNKGVLVLKIGKFGPFLSCSLYPACKNTAKLSEYDKPSWDYLKRMKKAKVSRKELRQAQMLLDEQEDLKNRWKEITQ